MAEPTASAAQEEIYSPQPGTAHMPAWTVGELPEAPKFRWSQLALMVGPGLVMGASAIGGGEWLTGPLVTARYGGALLWLATLSILFQVIYNVEINDGHALVTMTLTTPHCPVAESMPGEVELRVGSVPGIGDAEVNLVWDPPWSPAAMTDEARLELGML